MPRPDPTVPASPVRPAWPRRRRPRFALAAVLALAGFAALLAVFDWTWFRPLIQQHVHERSGRRIDFDSLHIGLDAAWQPTVRLRNLLVQNAAWATPQPLVRAASVGFTLTWQSLRGKQIVMTRLAIADAELDLERRADGLRNWRLTRPDDRGPGRVRVMELDVRDTRVRLRDDSIGLELELRAEPAPAAFPALASHPGLALTRQITVRGSRNGTPFDAQLATSPVLTLFDTGRPFALRGELRAGASPASRGRVEGTLMDLAQLARLDLAVQFAGPRLADLGSVLGVRAALPARLDQLSAQVWKEGARGGDERWRFSTLQMRIGRSQVRGEAQFERKPPGEGSSSWRATLASERLHVADFQGGSVRAGSAGSSSSPAPGARAPAPGGAALPKASPPNPMTADVSLSAQAVDGLPLGPLTRASARALLRDGRWAIEPVAFEVAGGRASGSLAVQTRRADAPAEYALDLRLQGLQFERLARAVPRLQPLAGGLDARVSMRSQGNSRASLAAAATGLVQADLVRATIPATLDAKLALDAGRWVSGLFSGDNGTRTPVTCATLDLRFTAGRGAVQQLALETPRLALTGAGWLDLGRSSLDVLLTPRRKQSALLALDRALHLDGPLSAPRVTLQPLGDAPGARACARGTAP